MTNTDPLDKHQGVAKPTFAGQENKVPNVHKSVFSRFCQCGANVTIGLVTDDAYALVEENWNSMHVGEGHSQISRHEWLLEKLKAA